MAKANKNSKNRYRTKLLQEFNRLKMEGSMLEVLEYARFIREEEKELQKFTHVNQHSSQDLKEPYLPVDNSKELS